MEAVHTEGGGGDNVEVTYIMSGGAEPTSDTKAIDGKLFNVYVDPSEVGGGGGGGGGNAPTLKVERSGTGLTLTFTGTLQSADKVTGPYADQAGASPLTVTPAGAAKFYRAKQ
jgi:hypothetical protein